MADSIAYLLRELSETQTELERCRKRLRRAQARARPRAKPVPPQLREWGVEHWRQHDLIVARIRAIPDRA